MFEHSDKAIYESIAEKATHHFGESPLSRIARVADYDPKKLTHDFTEVYFEADPKFYTTALFDTIASKVMKSSRRQMRKQVVAPFRDTAWEAKESLQAGRLAVMTGHQTMFEPGFAFYGLQRALEKTGENYGDLARNSHLIVARALSTVELFGKYPLTSLANQITNIHFTFPQTANYKDIPKDFRSFHNRRTIASFLKETRKIGSIGIVAASATTEKKVDGILELQPITSGTARLFSKDWDILPVGGTFKPDNFDLVPGEIIPASDVNSDRLDEAMDWIAYTRRKNGVPAVYLG